MKNDVYDEGLNSSHWDAIYEQQTKSSWFANEDVVAELNVRITGQNTFWLTWLFTVYLNSLGFQPKHALSIGCGDGEHELVIGRNSWVESLDAFDASPVGVQIANTKSVQENLNVNFFVDTFESFSSEYGPTKKYDLILFIGSLHHVKDVESMLS